MTAEDASAARKVVDLNHVRPQDRGEVWRLVSAPNFEMANLPDRISAHGVAYYLGPVTLTRSRHPRQTLVRTVNRIRFDGADDIFCSVELDGPCRAGLGETVRDIGPGQVTLWDMGRPSEKHSQAGETLCIRIERDAWQRAAGGDRAIHGRTLGSLGRCSATICCRWSALWPAIRNMQAHPWATPRSSCSPPACGPSRGTMRTC